MVRGERIALYKAYPRLCIRERKSALETALRYRSTGKSWPRAMVTVDCKYVLYKFVDLRYDRAIP
jgi:hypothetical protein